MESPEGEVSLSAVRADAPDDLIVKLMTLASRERINHFFSYAEGIEPASDLYLAKFTPYDSGFFSEPPEVTVSYESDGGYKQPYYYSWRDLSFVKLEVSSRDALNQTISFQLPEKHSVMFALFNESRLTGLASWYVHPKYRGELIAASRDFGREAELTVRNSENGREVTVTVKDYGPKICRNWTDEELEKMGPCQERILDLSKTAFEVLAPSWQGMIEVDVIAGNN